jgi:beta-lactamase class A
MYRVLTRIYWNDEALSQIPPWVQVASKQGAVSAARSEVVLVNAPSGDYVFSILTDDQADTSWDYDNEGAALIRKLSGALWSFFEPGSTWKPAPGSARYR